MGKNYLYFFFITSLLANTTFGSPGRFNLPPIKPSDLKQSDVSRPQTAATCVNIHAPNTPVVAPSDHHANAALPSALPDEDYGDVTFGDDVSSETEEVEGEGEGDSSASSNPSDHTAPVAQATGCSLPPLLFPFGRPSYLQ